MSGPSVAVSFRRERTSRGIRGGIHHLNGDRSVGGGAVRFDFGRMVEVTGGATTSRFSIRHRCVACDSFLLRDNSFLGPSRRALGTGSDLCDLLWCARSGCLRYRRACSPSLCKFESEMASLHQQRDDPSFRFDVHSFLVGLASETP